MKNLKQIKNPKSTTQRKSSHPSSTSKISQGNMNQKDKTYSHPIKPIPSNILHNPCLNISHYSLLMTNLTKYNYSKTTYEIKLVNSIIYDEKRHIVSLFKNHLLWDETSDFLKRYYNKTESMVRIPRISVYYENYCVISPMYFNLTSAKIMLKNTKKKRKLIDENIEEDEENNEEEDDNKNDSMERKKNEDIASLFIKPEEVYTESAYHSMSQSELSCSIRHIADNDPFHMRFQSNGNMDMSLTQYQNDSRMIDNKDLSSVLNNCLFGNFSISTKELLSEGKSTGKSAVGKINKTPMEMRKLNFDGINERQMAYPKYNNSNVNEKSKTDRSVKKHLIVTRHNNNNNNSKRKHKEKPIVNKIKSPTIESAVTGKSTGNNTNKKNICLDVRRLIDYPKPLSINPLSQRSNNNTTSSSNHNPFTKVINYRITSPDYANKTRKLILSNHNLNKNKTNNKPKPSYVIQHKPPIINSNSKNESNHIYTSTNPTSANFSKKTSKIITVIKGHQTTRNNPTSIRPRLETEEKQRNSVIHSQSITPKGIIISHKRKVTPQIIRRHPTTLDNPLNIKVNLKPNPTRSFSKHDSPPILKKRIVNKKSPLQTLTINNSLNIPDFSHHRINQSAKFENGISNHKENSKKCSIIRPSRNTKIRLSNYPTSSSPSKRHDIINQHYKTIYPSKSSSIKSTPGNQTLATNSRIITINIKKGTFGLITPSEAQSPNNIPDFQLTTRHTTETVPRNLVNKIINKIST